MSNNTIRIISGLILVGLVTACVIIGRDATLIFIGLIGPLLIDEIITNFYDQSRTSKRYITAQTIYGIGYIFFNFYQVSQSSFSLLISAGVLISALFAAYLFLIYKKSEIILKIFKLTSWGAGFYALVTLGSLAYVIHTENWRFLLIGLLILNFMVDTAAYFTGRKFGKHKLWEAVSPKKTIEGLLGGVFFSVLFTSVFWNAFVAKVTPGTIIFFAFLAVCSQVGDLAQSKLKRQFEIKDSSALIPGHGGVYDRVDSLLFVSPIYALYLFAFF
jgi:phosphatidate cytidylyltransferase